MLSLFVKVDRTAGVENPKLAVNGPISIDDCLNFISNALFLVILAGCSIRNFVCNNKVWPFFSQAIPL
jgi:hypothetical protein